MISILKKLDCGNLYQKRKMFEYIVAKFFDIEKKIIPLLKKYRIFGVKSLDFEDWCLVAELIKAKKHLTKDGLDQIRKIKAGMNRGRKESKFIYG